MFILIHSFSLGVDPIESPPAHSDNWWRSELGLERGIKSAFRFSSEQLPKSAAEKKNKKSTLRRQRGGASWWIKWRLRCEVLASSWGRRVVLREIEVVMCVFVTTCSLLSTWWQHAVEHKGECLRAVSEELSLIKCKVYWSKGQNKFMDNSAQVTRS